IPQHLTSASNSGSVVRPHSVTLAEIPFCHMHEREDGHSTCKGLVLVGFQRCPHPSPMETRSGDGGANSRLPRHAQRAACPTTPTWTRWESKAGFHLENEICTP
ncbi:unnamed protein product, partial [Ectocarpus sp. 13 AM-2016]